VIRLLDCQICGYSTLHEESAVPDSESATIWHCLICGHERRPNEPGSPNDPAKLKPKPLDNSGGIQLPTPNKKSDKELVDAAKR
jgi:hypothetical protein